MNADPQLINYAQGACQILKTSLDLARGSQPAFYRVCAAQLRLLLCDTTRQHGEVVNVSLLPRIFPDIRLHPLKKDTEVNNGIFDLEQAPLLLTEWLEQSLPVKSINKKPIKDAGRVTIRGLIRQVCDHDGGAHVDPRPKSDLDMLVDTPGWILAISSYIIERVVTELF